MPFESLAFLLTPADPSARSAVLEAGPEWRFEVPQGLDADVVLWGREPLPFGTSPWVAARFAAARERAILRLRSGRHTRWTEVRVHRLPPPTLRSGPIRHLARSAALGGAIVDLAVSGASPRVLDAVVAAAMDSLGSRNHPASSSRRFHPGSGGSGLVRIQAERGPAVLRVARIDSAAALDRNGDALAALATGGLPVVPALLGRGATAGASWTVETELPGRRARRLAPGLEAAVVDFCRRLPRSEEPPRALAEDLRTIGERFRETAGSLVESAARAEAALSTMPSVVRHGDLWVGNLLARGERLTGVVDWDAWHPRGVPGADLLHLIGMDEAARSGRSLGQVWIDRPWAGQRYRSATTRYWNELGGLPSTDVLDAVGLAWWASHVANAAARLPELATDERWIRRNVEPVIRSLGGPVG